MREMCVLFCYRYNAFRPIMKSSDDFGVSTLVMSPVVSNGVYGMSL